MLFIKTFPPRLFAQDFFAQDFSTQDLPPAASRRPFFIAAGPRQVSNGLTANKTTALPIREAAAIVGCRFPDQLLRRPSAARFHCDTLSAIMRVDFMAAWLSWA